MNRKLFILGLIFILVGLGVFVKAFLDFQETKNLLDQGILTQGEVVEVVKEITTDPQGKKRVYYLPIVKFTAQDDQTIEFKDDLIKSSTYNYQVGQGVEVLYPADNPAQARILSFLNLWFNPLSIFAIAVICLGVGGFLIFYFVIGPNLNKDYLKEHGKDIEAEILKISSTSEHSFTILAQWTDPSTNKKYYFLSEELPSDPKDQLKKGTIRVLIDPKNPNKYVMDTSFLKKD